jgi:hypothetical protein
MGPHSYSPFAMSICVLLKSTTTCFDLAGPAGGDGGLVIVEQLAGLVQRHVFIHSNLLHQNQEAANSLPSHPSPRHTFGPGMTYFDAFACVH